MASLPGVAGGVVLGATAPGAEAASGETWGRLSVLMEGPFPKGEGYPGLRRGDMAAAIASATLVLRLDQRYSPATPSAAAWRRQKVTTQLEKVSLPPEVGST
mmetsp:Transcript_27737/g.61211  ORF Transcript_27737/g.61211 Transcript_27737/m.61211 type:complete len:102 (+) Transcript_27737:306-611(+)